MKVINKRRVDPQTRWIFGRRAGEISATTVLQSVLLLIMSAGIGAYLTIGLQQLIAAYDQAALTADPTALHEKSVFPLTLIAIAIGAFGGKAGYWIVLNKRFLMSAIGLGLLGGFAFYQILAKIAVDNNYYLFVLVILSIVAWSTFAASGGMKKLFQAKPRPGLSL